VGLFELLLVHIKVFITGSDDELFILDIACIPGGIYTDPFPVHQGFIPSMLFVSLLRIVPGLPVDHPGRYPGCPGQGSKDK